MLPQTPSTTALQNAQQPDKWATRERPVDNDAFAQLFANTQEASRHQEKIAPRENNAPEPREAPARTCRPHETAAPRNNEQEDNRSASVENEEQQDETVEAKPHHTNEEKPKTCDKGEKKSKMDGECAETAGKENHAADSQTPKPEVAEVADPTLAVEVDAAVDVATDEKPAVVFCLSPALQAQAEASGSAGAGEKEDGAKTPAKQDGQDSLQNLLSFRPDSKAGVAASGKPAGNDAPADPALKADVAASLTVKPQGEEAVDVKTKSEAELKLAASAETPVEKPANENADFAALIQNAPKSKKEELKEQNLAAAKGEAKPDADNGLTSPPAAGSRVNASIGFSAPTPTGSGGGSPPPKGGEVQTVSGVGLTAGTNDLSKGASVQLTRATPGTAHTPPAEQVGVAINRMIKSGTTQFEIQLSPAELGKVDIKLEISQDGLVRATVTADNPAAYAALQKDAGNLEKILQQAGLETDANSLSFNLREGDTQRQQQEANQNSPGWKRWNENADTVDQGEQAQLAYYVATPGRVDVMV
jgi:flagellar hook-length control protein FliK